MAAKSTSPCEAQRRIEPYLSRLFGYALSLTQDRDRARDLVQECAVHVFAAGRVPVEAAAYRAWLFRIMRNAFLDGQRRRAVRAAVDGDDGANPIDEVWRCDERMVSVLNVRLGMAKLSPAHREIIALIDIGGFSYLEAGDFLGIPKGTVMSRLSRARAALLDIIGKSRVRSLPVEKKRAAK